METKSNQQTSQTVPAVFDEKSYAMWMHLSQFVGLLFPFGSIVAPLIMWVTRKNESKLVDDHGKDILNFQISIIVWSVISFILILVLIGIFLFIGLFIFELVVIIKAAISARDGVSYRYPLTIQFIK